MTKKNKYIIFFLFSFLISNDFIIEFSENDSSLVQIYYNSENSIIPSYVYPVYTRIMLYDQNNDLIDDITSSMTKAYWKGSNDWVYNLSYEISMHSLELRFANSLENLSYEYESFRAELVKSDNIDIIKKLLIDKKYSSAMLYIEDILTSSSNIELKAECLYLKSEIFLNDFNDYENASIHLENIVDNYSKTQVSKKAIFSLAYLYANYLGYYTDAVLLYDKFKNLYPSDDLIPSINYELEILRNIK
tara:strand:+ start:102 stop:842 length:741 start_codon:yes stop_codon:yes gene_type:complete